MLDALRGAAGTWVAKLFIGLLIMSFAVWGVADFTGGVDLNAVAKVGKTNVSGLQLQRATANRVTLDQLILQAAMNDRAKSYNLGISEEALTKAIAEDPIFQAGTGRFSRFAFQNILSRLGYTEDDYIEERKIDELRVQLIGALTGGFQIPDTALEAYGRYQNQERTIRALVIDRNQVEAPADPDQTALESFYEDRKSSFRAPEYRSFSYIKLEPEDIAKPGDVTDVEVEDSYKADLARYETAEQRRVQQVLFPSEDEAKAFKTKLDGGMSFEDALKERNLTPEGVDLGLLTRQQFTDAGVADAAFSLTEGTVSDVLAGTFGSIVIRLAEVKPAAVQPLSEVEGEIRASIAAQKAENEILDLHDAIEDERAGGSNLEQVAEKLGMPIEIVTDADASGALEAGGQLEGLTLQNEALRAVFGADAGEEINALDVSGRGFVWVETTSVKAARDRTLDEVRDQAIAAWKEAETAKAVEAFGQELAGLIKSGDGTMDLLAASLGLSVVDTGAIKRTDQSALPPSVATAAFDKPQGTIDVLPGSNATDRIVYHVTEVKDPAFFKEAAENQPIANGVANEVQNELISQYVFKLQSELGVTINQRAVNAIMQTGQQQHY
ncbi:peptidyl-prolyl cis-trans isomerase [Coralliovum pocilloporae]|uniref:peptidyl-prolyl cis-trans isomerase n=1 Tax=Coralliovum pocilloporae TaxID=3066369 RepID=UPI0033072E1F